MDDHEALVSNFCSISGTTQERARFYLESANWELSLALSSFYDSSNAEEIPNTGGDMDIDLHPELSREEAATSPGSFQSQQPPAFAEKREKVKAKASSRFASLRDFEKDDDQSSEEEGQRFYAGGSEHSGELIVGPPRKKQSNEEIAKNLFKQARKHGAQPLDASARDAGKSGDSKPKYFGGGGYKLGESNETSQFVPGAEESPDSRPVNVVLRLWSNGFTVDDEPLRDFNDPANQDFLNSVKQGEIPRELLRKSRGGEVHVDMEDHRQEEYKAPKKKVKPFSGQGHMLGSRNNSRSVDIIARLLVGDLRSVERDQLQNNPPAPEFCSGSKPIVQKSSSVDPPVVIDKLKPTTILQIRLADGKRLRQEFNQNHRISDVRSFVVSSNPESASRPFVLMTTFPNKELSDENLTLSDAKLLNALVVQKMV